MDDNSSHGLIYLLDYGVTGIDGKHVQTSSTSEMEVTGISSIVSGTTVAPANFPGYVGITCGKTEGGATSVAYDGAGLPFAGRVLVCNYFLFFVLFLCHFPVKKVLSRDFSP